MTKELDMKEVNFWFRLAMQPAKAIPVYSFYVTNFKNNRAMWP